MIVIESSVATTAKPATIWNRWIDIATWHEWNPAIVSIALRGGFNVGTRGTLKMTVGQPAEFEITYVEADKGFDMTAPIWSGSMTFKHRIESLAGVQRMVVTVETNGWASWIYGYSMRYLLKRELPACLTQLALLVEADQKNAEQDLHDARFKSN